jgi:hypothetical protein
MTCNKCGGDLNEHSLLECKRIQESRNKQNAEVMLSQIASYVEGFAKSDEDSTLLCVLYLLADYYQLKSNEAYQGIEQELNTKNADVFKPTE